MTSTLRYRLIQILELLLWLGFLAGLLRIGLQMIEMRPEGWRAMLSTAGVEMLGLGAGMAGLIVLIGIYHNSRRNADALEKLARQGAGGVRRLQAATRGDAPATPVQQPQPQQAEAAHADPPRFAPAPSLSQPASVSVQDSAAARLGQRRLGPAS
ncbi:hypothetical protein [Paracoccus sediminicola]|uniref:hypothetical protein n=1 Tax=Paracoccus sediminicola TaxID=3017783 RepID=UPI0022F01DA7|nr:hypothetical protein [Paracoccus sediminicola]WBU55992.1 hypothetical protein PAF18_10825 [Paracoccus sediminicola]